MSRRSSPRKSVEEAAVMSNGGTGDQSKPENISPTKKKSTTSSGSGLKLRLKVNSSNSTGVGSNEEITPSGGGSTSTPATFKIKLNFSRSNESVEQPVQESKKKGRRGRPKKDKSAVMAAAIAASRPNEVESEERRSRRRAAEEKIKKSASNDNITVTHNVLINEESFNEKKRRKRDRNAAETGEEDDNNKRRRRRRSLREDSEGSEGSGSLRRSRSNDYVDITETTTTNGSSMKSSDMMITSNTGIIGASTSTSLNPHETEFIQRSKTFLNIALQHEVFLYTSMLSNPLDVTPFKSTEDIVEKLSAFHVGIGAGQYTAAELELDNECGTGNNSSHLDTFNALQQRYRDVIHSTSSKKVPTELLLLEQRLCLEEEKFLLVKLKNEYAARFMKPSGNANSAGSSRSSTPSVQ